MKRILFSIFLLLSAAAAYSQIIKGSGIMYYDSIPNFDASLPNGSEFSYGVKTKKLYYWNRPLSKWEAWQDSVYQITVVPDTATLDTDKLFQGDLFINSGGDTLGVWNGVHWLFFAGGNGIISALPADNVAINADSHTLAITNLLNLVMTGSSAAWTIQNNGGNINLNAPAGTVQVTGDHVNLNPDSTVVLRVSGVPFFSVGPAGIGIENPVLDSVTETTHLVGLPGTSGIMTIFPISDLGAGGIYEGSDTIPNGTVPVVQDSFYFSGQTVAYGTPQALFKFGKRYDQYDTDYWGEELEPFGLRYEYGNKSGFWGLHPDGFFMSDTRRSDNSTDSHFIQSEGSIQLNANATATDGVLLVRNDYVRIYSGPTAGTSSEIKVDGLNNSVDITGRNDVDIHSVLGEIKFGTGATNLILPKIRPGSNSFWRFNSDGTGEYIAASAVGTTDLTFTGASTPFTLNSSTGTDVTFSEGYGINQARTSNDLQTAVDTAQIVTVSALADSTAAVRAADLNGIYTQTDTIPTGVTPIVQDSFHFSGLLNGVPFRHGKMRAGPDTLYWGQVLDVWGTHITDENATHGFSGTNGFSFFSDFQNTDDQQHTRGWQDQLEFRREVVDSSTLISATESFTSDEDGYNMEYLRPDEYSRALLNVDPIGITMESENTDDQRVGRISITSSGAGIGMEDNSDGIFTTIRVEAESAILETYGPGGLIADFQVGVDSTINANVFKPISYTNLAGGGLVAPYPTGDTHIPSKYYVDMTGAHAPQTENIESASFTAILTEINLVDCSGGAITVTPPSIAFIIIGQRFAVSDATASADTNNITIDFTGAGQDLYGASQDYIINVAGGYVEFIYMGATTGWIATKG